MVQAAELIQEINNDLQPVREQLLTHPYIAALEAGAVSRAELRRIAGEQYAIIGSDLHSVANLVSRYVASFSRKFFLDVLAGELAASEALLPLGRALGMSEADLANYEPMPGAHAYTTYMAWLGSYGGDAEVAAAYLVNFRAWGENCGRLSYILQQQYGLAPADVKFFDNFAAVAPEFETAALAVIQNGLDHGSEPRLIRRAARLLQGYELMFWDSLYQAHSNAAEG